MSRSLNVTHQYLKDEPSDQNPFLWINVSEDQTRELHQKVHIAFFTGHQVQVARRFVSLALGTWCSGLRCV